ncbi:hypothetical protein WT27_13735 [Burkholderia territorii]|uniref:Uncharacterized protein n=1 Tax=Burkholderia territorii TaxID=1503055 RepID=A0A105V522_9BURK|nr:hypothetical protein WT27_13735 [Burkholderia territorii]
MGVNDMIVIDRRILALIVDEIERDEVLGRSVIDCQLLGVLDDQVALCKIPGRGGIERDSTGFFGDRVMLRQTALQLRHDVLLYVAKDGGLNV